MPLNFTDAMEQSRQGALVRQQQAGPQQNISTDTALGTSYSNQINQVLDLIMKMQQRASGQMGDIGALARGETGQLGPSPADKALVEQSIGASSDIARRQLEQFLSELMPQISQGMASRGIGGSSMEMAQRAIGGREATRQFGDILSRAQGQGAEALMQLPFQRAQTQLGANQLLFQQLMGAVMPVTSTRLQQLKKKPKPKGAGDIIGQTLGSVIGGVRGGQQTGQSGQQPYDIMSDASWLTQLPY